MLRLEAPPIQVFAPMDFRQMPVEDGSVDLVMTDPLYHRDKLGLWEDVAEWSERKLKDGGRFFAFTGTMFLDQVLARVTKHLRWMDLFTILYPGMFRSRASEKYVRFKRTKAAVLFTKGDYDGRNTAVKDTYFAKSHDHAYHKYQLPLDATMYWMERLTHRNDLVADPFAGGWTTGIAARKLHRRYVGTDIDPAMMEVWHRRLRNGD
jgi:DNA modification methylase